MYRWVLLPDWFNFTDAVHSRLLLFDTRDPSSVYRWILLPGWFDISETMYRYTGIWVYMGKPWNRLYTTRV